LRISPPSGSWTRDGELAPVVGERIEGAVADRHVPRLLGDDVAAGAASVRRYEVRAWTEQGLVRAPKSRAWTVEGAPWTESFAGRTVEGGRRAPGLYA
jgi:hypothetical protein